MWVIQMQNAVCWPKERKSPVSLAVLERVCAAAARACLEKPARRGETACSLCGEQGTIKGTLPGSRGPRPAGKPPQTSPPAQGKGARAAQQQHHALEVPPVCGAGGGRPWAGGCGFPLERPHCLQPPGRAPGALGGTASGGAGPRGAAASPPEAGPACLFPSPLQPPGVGQSAVKELELCNPSRCSWAPSAHSAALGAGGEEVVVVLVATGGLVLAGMVPAGIGMESREKDAIRRMGWVRKKRIRRPAGRQDHLSLERDSC